MSTEQEQVQRLESLVARRKELLERKLRNDLKAISLKRSLGYITEAEAALEEQAIIAAEADRIVETSTFKEKFCNYYAQNKPVADSLDSFAQFAYTIITSVNPLWMAEPATASMVATLGGAVILKKTVDVFSSNRSSFVVSRDALLLGKLRLGLGNTQFLIRIV
jgi:hypothetical protein